MVTIEKIITKHERWKYYKMETINVNLLAVADDSMFIINKKRA